MQLKSLLPKGRYNGKVIHGFKVSFAVALFDWNWLPKASFNLGEPYLLWLCFTIRFYLEYDHGWYK